MTDFKHGVWYAIDSAPKDGTVIRAKNELIEYPLDIRWTDFNGSKQWVLVKDYDPFMPLRAGHLVTPTHWMPLPPEDL